MEQNGSKPPNINDPSTWPVYTSWFMEALDGLKQGKTVKVRPHGWGMYPKFGDKALCTIEPLKDWRTLKEGDVVFCKIGKSYYLHFIRVIQESKFQIANAKGKIVGWASEIYGILTKVEK